MRQLTIREVNEQFGGKLPNDATLRPEDDEAQSTPPPPPSSPPSKRGRRSRAERFRELNAFVDMGMAGLTGAETKVWLVLFRDCKAGGTARTGQADIARRAGLTCRSVKRAIRTLQGKGFIRVVRRGKLNCGPSVYRLRPVGDD